MRVYLFFLLFPILISCKNNPAEKNILIAAAANVQYPIDKIIKTFEEKSGIKVECVIASSGKLTSQIIEGAPFDIFISADTKYPEALHEKGLVMGDVKVYATGLLVIWSHETNLGLSDNLNFITESHIRKIAIPNPDYAPYGVAAMEAIENSGIYEKIKPKLVYGQNISQTSQYIFTKAVDIGFTAKSVVLSEPMKEYSNWIEVDPVLYSPIHQGAVLIKKNGSTQEAKEFYDFLFSEACQKIFLEYGYMQP